jgi:hypothetical protein
MAESVSIRHVGPDTFRVVVGGKAIELSEAQLRAVQSQRSRDAFRREVALSKRESDRR